MKPRYSEVEALALIIGGKGQRFDLLDRADAYTALYGVYGSIEKISQITRIERSTVDRYIRISRLPSNVKKVLREIDVSSYHVASELSRITPNERQLKVAMTLLHIPREKARDVIRFLYQHPEVEVDAGLSIVLENYDDVLKGTILVLDPETLGSSTISKIKLEAITRILNEKIGIRDGLKLKILKEHLVVFFDASSKKRIPRRRGETSGQALERIIKDVSRLV